MRYQNSQGRLKLARTNRTASQITSFSLLVTALAAAYPVLSLAQTTPAGSGTVQQTSEIVVSASRVNRAGFTAPTPTTELGAQDFQSRSATVVADVLYDLPSVRPAPAPTVVSQAGGNFVNLRGLGNQRTLVLVDGRRFVPSNNAGTVDTNVVPTALIDRVDVVTGGASAAWGSDAVAGVTNLVLKRKLAGFQGNVQYGMSGHSDAKNAQASLAWGTGFAQDRGQFMVAGEYSKTSDMPTNADRDWSNKHTAYTTQNGVRVITDGLTLSGYTNGGVIVQQSGAPLAVGNVLRGKQFLNSSSSSPYNYGTILGNSVQIGGDGGWISDSASPVAPLERKTLFGRGTFEFTPDLRAFAEASYSSTNTSYDLFTNSIPSSTDGPILIQNGNPYIPSDIQAIMNAPGGPQSFYLGRIVREIGGVHTKSKNEITRYAFGLDGNFGETWSWKTYATHGKTKFDTQFSNNFIESNLRASLDVVINPLTGRPDCRINTPGGAAAVGSPAYGAAPGCVPSNPFGAGSFSQAALAYVAGTLGNVVTYKQDAAGLSLQGEPFNNWAGPVSFATGLDYRKESITQVVSPYSDFLNPPSFGAGGFQQANPKSFAGGNNVKEIFAETVFPLLANQPLIKSLDLNAAVRSTDYSNSGRVTTWKGGVTYVPVTGVLIRGTRSRDIRAAGLFELYGRAVTYGAVQSTGGTYAAIPGVAPAFTGPQNFSAITTGNLKLTPEEADTTTVGITLSPTEVPGLSLSADYYKINLNKTIGLLGSQGIMDACYGRGQAAGLTPDPSKCALIDFTSGVITNQQLNLGLLSTKGVDLEASYRFPLNSMIAGTSGTMTVRALATYVGDLIFNNNGLQPFNRAGDLNGQQAGVPHWRGNVSGTYQTGPWTVFLQGRYIMSAKVDNTLQDSGFASGNSIPSRFYLNTSVQYTVYDKADKGRLQVYGNINNLLDKDPPLVLGTNGLNAAGAGQGGLITNAGYYDTIGRAFTLGLRFSY